MNISFTGHREFEPHKLTKSLRSLILEICQHHSEGVVFWCGMASGFDMAAGEAVIEARRELGESFKGRVKLQCVIPFEGHDRYLSAEENARYHNILDESDTEVTLSSRYDNLVFLRRNDYLLDQADMLIAYHSGTKKGGTAYTVRNATKRKIPVRNIYPQLQLSLWAEEIFEP